MKTLDIIIPVYNEELVLLELLNRIEELKNKIEDKLKTNVIFVNDGSKDNSLKILKTYSKKKNYLKIISFSRNFGHQIAVTAGLENSNSDFIAILDADLQDPPEIIIDMYSIMEKEKVDVVYGKRRQRFGESFFKLISAKIFYKFLNYMCEVDIPSNTGDFRLITKRVVDNLKIMKEKHRFIRGMIPWIGFKSRAFIYDRSKRFAGSTKYPFKKMMEFAINAILSFSSKPLKLGINMGIVIILLSILLSFVILLIKIFTDYFIPGFVAIVIAITMFGGLNMFLIGLTGEYVSRIFEESKKRPLYVISEKINFN